MCEAIALISGIEKRKGKKGEEGNKSEEGQRDNKVSKVPTCLHTVNPGLILGNPYGSMNTAKSHT